MGQSLARNYVHIVFSTKHRQPFITKEIEEELWTYLGGTCKALECNPIIVGGHLDHVHILCTLSKNVALKTLLEEVKKRASKWIKTKGKKFEHFYWQAGYGAFSVSHEALDVVTTYIQNQEQHHQKLSFQDELRASLNKYQVEYDERYVWD